MGETMTGTSTPHRPWARVLIVAGAFITLASAVVGFVLLQHMPELRPVDFGQQVLITAARSTPATIFASTGLSQPPSCQVTSGNGAPVTLGEAERYLQGDGLESAFGFPVTSGTTYTVTCTSATDGGRFAVAQDTPFTAASFLAAGLLGLVTSGVGVVSARRHRAMNGSSHSTR